MKNNTIHPVRSENSLFSFNQIPARFFLAQVIIQTLVLVFWFGLAAPAFSY